MTRRMSFALFSALVLLGGRAAAVCSACCPVVEGPKAPVLAALDCCGDCGPSLERRGPRASLAAKKAESSPPASVSVSPAIAPPSVPLRFAWFQAKTFLAPSTLACPSPLRL